MLSLILLVISLAAIILGLIWFVSRRNRKIEPIIELEKLIHCKSCGSLIPETTNRCAFCGKSKREVN